MATVSDYSTNSRFRADKGFSIVTRRGYEIASPVLLPTPIRGPDDTAFVVPLRLQFRWDLIAHETLGNVDLKWVIMRHNRISDPFTSPRVGQVLLVPSNRQVRYYLNR